jgi:glycosyltransferase involved in cell wall biosynthesis
MGNKNGRLMKIAFAISGLSMASGPTTFCVKVIEGLARADCDVDLYVAKLAGVVLRPQDERVKVVVSGKSFRPEGFPELLHVHALWNMFSHHVAVYAKKHKIPYIVSSHGMLAPWALRHKRLKKRIAWGLYQKKDLTGATMFHATAECEITWLRELGFKQPCVLAPLGSDLPDLNHAATQRRREVKKVLFVGRIYPVKGLMNLVRAWAAVKKSSFVHDCDRALMDLRTDELSHWQLVIAGPDQAGHKAELVAEAKRLDLTIADVTTDELMHNRTHTLSPDIVFTGPVYGADKDALYRMADLFVLPSFTENFGVVVTDALSYGVPVITTKGTPWSELLGYCDHSVVASVVAMESVKPGTGRAGWWIDIGVEPLAAALREAINLSDDERHAMGENGRRLVEAKYTWPAIAEQMKVAYEWILCGGEKPDCVVL